MSYLSDMKKLVILFAVVFVINANAQYAIAGIPGAIYVDLTPSYYLQFPDPPSGGQTSYSIDINQDGTKDIEILCGGGAYGFINNIFQEVLSLDSNTSFSYGGQTVSGTCSGFNNYDIIKLLNTGDTIQNGTFISSAYLSFSFYEGGGYPCSSSGYADTGSYIGVRYKTGTSISYGWVKFVDTIGSYGGAYLIRSFSLGAPLAGIQQLKNISEQITIYPNPNNGSFVIEPNSTTKQTMQVHDVNGKLLLSQTIEGKTTIDASTLNEGVYNISMISTDGILNKRLVIVR